MHVSIYNLFVLFQDDDCYKRQHRPINQPRDIRPPEEITQEELDMVAERSTGKVYDVHYVSEGQRFLICCKLYKKIIYNCVL